MRKSTWVYIVIIAALFLVVLYFIFPGRVCLPGYQSDKEFTGAGWAYVCLKISDDAGKSCTQAGDCKNSCIITTESLTNAGCNFPESFIRCGFDSIECKDVQGKCSAVRWDGIKLTPEGNVSAPGCLA